MDKNTPLEYYKAAFDPKVEYFNVPLMKGAKIIERPADQTTITKRYTEEVMDLLLSTNKNHSSFTWRTLCHMFLCLRRKILREKVKEVCMAM